MTSFWTLFLDIIIDIYYSIFWALLHLVLVEKDTIENLVITS